MNIVPKVEISQVLAFRLRLAQAAPIESVRIFESEGCYSETGTPQAED